MHGLLTVMVLICVFALSDGALFTLSIDYTAPTGSMFEKIHPAVYLLSFIVALRLLRSNYRRAASTASVLLMLTAFLVLQVLVVVRSDLTGGEQSAIIVTFLCSALAGICINGSGPGSMTWLRAPLATFFTINSLVGIIEVVTGERLFPFIISGAEKVGDPRATAFMGHPLINSCITGCFLILLYFRRDIRFRHAILAINAGGLIAFGGRTAVVMILVILILDIVTFQLGSSTVRAQTNRMIGMFALAAAAIFALIAFSSSSPVELFTDRFFNDDGSANQRISAFAMLEELTLDEWLIGASGMRTDWLKTYYASKSGIEISWVALLITYGLPSSALLFVAVAWVIRDAVRSHGPIGAYLFIYFLLLVSASLSIGTKTLLLTQFMFLMAIYRPPVAQAPKVNG